MLKFKIKLSKKRCESNHIRKETSVDVRQMIIRLHSEGNSYSEIADIVKRSRSTIASIIQRSREGRVVNGHRTGKPSLLNDRDRRLLLRNVEQHPQKSAPALTSELALAVQKDLHPETVRRVLRKNGYHGRRPRRKPFISMVNEKKRLEFAHKYLNEENMFWESVLFSDESKFNIYGSDGRGYVWRKNNEALKKNLRATVKHGGGGVLVWGCMSASGVGKLVFIDGNMDQNMYLNILQDNLQASVDLLGLPPNWIFQQDNDPKHTARLIKEWLLYRVPKQLNSPPQSPDLNPIEHLWEELDRRIRLPHIRCKITNKETLKTELLAAWNAIPPTITRNLVQSMQKRLQAVITTNGGPTKY